MKWEHDELHLSNHIKNTYAVAEATVLYLMKWEHDELQLTTMMFAIILTANLLH
jgi:hypothetical protein